MNEMLSWAVIANVCVASLNTVIMCFLTFLIYRQTKENAKNQEAYTKRITKASLNVDLLNYRCQCFINITDALSIVAESSMGVFLVKNPSVELGSGLAQLGRAYSTFIILFSNDNAKKMLQKVYKAYGELHALSRDLVRDPIRRETALKILRINRSDCTEDDKKRLFERVEPRFCMAIDLQEKIRHFYTDTIHKEFYDLIKDDLEFSEKIGALDSV